LSFINSEHFGEQKLLKEQSESKIPLPPEIFIYNKLKQKNGLEKGLVFPTCAK
jgi:hypothetical protein